MRKKKKAAPKRKSVNEVLAERRLRPRRVAPALAVAHWPTHYSQRSHGRCKLSVTKVLHPAGSANYYTLTGRKQLLRFMVTDSGQRVDY